MVVYIKITPKYQIANGKYFPILPSQEKGILMDGDFGFYIPASVAESVLAGGRLVPERFPVMIPRVSMEEFASLYKSGFTSAFIIALLALLLIITNRVPLNLGVVTLFIFTLDAFLFFRKWREKGG
jgi:hypothetical protein